MTTLIAFNGNKAVKAKYMKRLRAHAAADEIIHGTYWQDGKGCAVGCTIHSSDHSAYERELGIPQSIAKLEDNIFENLSNGDAKKFPVQFLSAIKTGADLSLVTPKFLLAVQKRNLERVRGQNEAVDKAIEQVIAVLLDWVKTGKANETSAESAARSAAESAAESAARSAAWSAESAARSAAWSAAESAARSAAWSAESAAWSAAWSAARSAARSAEYKWMAETLLKLLREAA